MPEHTKPGLAAVPSDARVALEHPHYGVDITRDKDGQNQNVSNSQLIK